VCLVRIDDYSYAARRGPRVLTKAAVLWIVEILAAAPLIFVECPPVRRQASRRSLNV
jgi:hypothetical protein